MEIASHCTACEAKLIAVLVAPRQKRTVLSIGKYLTCIQRIFFKARMVLSINAHVRVYTLFHEHTTSLKDVIGKSRLLIRNLEFVKFIAFSACNVKLYDACQKR